MTAEPLELRPWGQDWRPGIKYGDYSCPECNWSWFTLDVKSRIEYIIGFSRTMPTATRGWGGGEEKVGILIIECPKCFEKFWFHTTASHNRTLTVLLSKWPKSA